MKTYGRVEVWPYLSSPLNGSECSVSCLDTNWWVVPRAHLCTLEERKISCACPESNPGLPACCPSPYQLCYPSSKLTYIIFLNCAEFLCFCSVIYLSSICSCITAGSALSYTNLKNRDSTLKVNCFPCHPFIWCWHLLLTRGLEESYFAWSPDSCEKMVMSHFTSLTGSVGHDMEKYSQ
jgi:hypothetical protein